MLTKMQTKFVVGLVAAWVAVLATTLYAENPGSTTIAFEQMIKNRFGAPVAGTVPITSQVMTFNGSSWVPLTVVESGGGTLISGGGTNDIAYHNGTNWTARKLSAQIDAEITLFSDSSAAQSGDMLWRNSGRWDLIAGRPHNPAVQSGWFLKNDNGVPTWADASTAFQGGSLGSQLTWQTGLGAITHLAGPTDQPLKLRGGTNTGTNVVGKDLDLGGGLGTGTGLPGKVTISTGYTGTTGTTPHSEGVRVYKSPKVYNVVDGATTVMFTVPIATNEFMSFTVNFTGLVHATTPHFSTHIATYRVAAYNVSGTASGTVSSSAAGVTHTTLGTLTMTPTVANNAGSLDFRINTDSNLGSQDRMQVIWSVESDMPGFTLTPAP
jgi:hypothetical protein